MFGMFLLSFFRRAVFQLGVRNPENDLPLSPYTNNTRENSKELLGHVRLETTTEIPPLEKWEKSTRWLLPE
jgi:hypothetical protein